MSLTDQRIQYNERVVAANHPTNPDVDNRHALIQHDLYGAHKAVGPALTNKSGVSLAAGAVVILDAANDSAVTITTTATNIKPVLVMVKGPNNEGDPCADNALGMFATLGVATVNVQGNVARLNFLRTSATAQRAEDAGPSDTEGVFAVALTGYAGGGAGTVTAMLLGRTSEGPPSVPTGVPLPYMGTTAPAGYLLCDGAEVNATTYERLFTVAVPNIVSWGRGTAVGNFTADAGTDTLTLTSHGLVNGNVVHVANSGGALPGGLATATKYYVVGATSSTFQLSATLGGAAIDITSAGSGTHSVYNKFKVPDLRGRFPLGKDDMGGVAANRVTGAVALGGGGGSEYLLNHAHDMSAHTHTGPSHTHTMGGHTHTMGNHTHSTPAHSHALTINPNSSGTGTDHAISLSGSQLVAAPTGNNNNGVLYTTDSGGSGTSGAPSSNTSDGPSTNTTDASGTGTTGGPSVANTGNPTSATIVNLNPYQLVSYIVKT